MDTGKITILEKDNLKDTFSDMTHAVTPSQTKLILFAHGSRDPRWKSPFEAMKADLDQEFAMVQGPLQGSAQEPFQGVTLAYMEFATPTLMDAVNEAYAQGFRHVNVLPMFMAAGGHLRHDVPQQMTEAQSIYPELTMTLMEPIGENPQVVEAMKSVMRGALVGVK